MEIYVKLFEVIFPVFFIIGIGYFIGKKDKKFDTKFITNFAANVGSPAMIIYALNVKNISFQIFVDYFTTKCSKELTLYKKNTYKNVHIKKYIWQIQNNK